MKTKSLFLLLSGVILLAPVTQAGCAQKNGDLSFVQGTQRYVIDTRSSGVTISGPGGTQVETLVGPAAGPALIPAGMPPHILHYLLSGKGSISGLVWNDLDNNGTPDLGEHGIAVVLVYIDTDGNSTYTEGEPAQLTDANGMYTITGLKKGPYDVTIDTTTLPAGFGITTSYPISLNLAPHQALPDIDFGLQVLPGKISGTIWDQTDNLPVVGVVSYVDLNGDGKLTFGEPRGTTDGSGHFLIANIPPGTYDVYVDNKTLDPMFHTTPVSGANPTQVTLTPGGSETVNHTYLHKATICGTLADAGGRQWGNITIFIDLSGNGAYDEGEPTAVTDPAGKYCFDELYPGTYTLLLQKGQLPAGYEVLLSPGTITVGAGEASTANFAIYQPVTISGLVWDDASGNRVREPAENGLAGITVFLDVNNNGLLDTGEQSAITDAAGAYSLTDLEHGSFNIRADDTALLRAYIKTTTANPVQIILEPGQSYDGARFGYQKKLAPVHALYYPTRLGWSSDGNLYVSDNQLNSVFIYDSSLRLSGELKNLDKPLGVVTDSSGNIYVGNQGRKNVEVYDALGNLLRSIGNGSIDMPNDLALDRSNNLYVLDSATNRVLVYDQGGNLLSTISGAPWTGFARSIAIAYRGPVGVAVGELYVADGANCKIHVFSLDGVYQKSIGGPGSLYTTNWEGKFSGLSGVEVDQFGNVHGLDNNLNVVQVFEPVNGAFFYGYNAYPPANEYRLNLQTDFAIQPIDQRVVVSNLATRSVETVPIIPIPPKTP